jgi:transcriptional regulator with XRE-family HTH domain
MPASKQVHVLAILRKNLGLKQIDLAKMVSTSLDTIQSVETNRLALSESLAERIAAATGAPLAWLLANDLSAPTPPLAFKEDISAEQKDFMRGQILMSLGRAWGVLDKLDTSSAINLFNHFTWQFWSQLNTTFGEELSSLEAFELLKAATVGFHPRKWLEQQAERQAELRKKKQKVPKKLPPVRGLP